MRRHSVDINVTPLIDILLVLLIIFNRSDKTLFLMGDGALRYGEVVHAIDLAKGAGVERVGVVTESMRRGR